jgi:uncharacterized protein YdhG (YjbR/CyaY superfamily)
MQSKAATVDDYLKEVPAAHRELLTRIRELFRKELKGYAETMRYGSPCYEKNNIAEAGFASQKHFIGIYILKQDVIAQYRDELKGISVGKGVIRFTNPGKIDLRLLQKMLKATYLSKTVVCG